MSQVKDAKFPLPPGSMVGILGGGQLGRMLAMAGADLGMSVHIYCPDERAPARETAGAFTCAAYDDEAALRAFAGSVDVVTYEFENVPVDAVAILKRAGLEVRPGALALEKAQDRLREKEFLRDLDIAVAPFHAVDALEDLRVGLDSVGHPAILKTRRLGYDGKGQTRITDRDIDLHASFEKATEFAWSEVGAAPSILEGFVPFTAEISVIGARGADGEVRLFDPARNDHVDGVLKRSTLPSGAPDTVLGAAGEATCKILGALDYVGVIGVEFFMLADGALIANEFAPRVHNSGHWTSDACALSQFEQHMRAVAGWPLGDPARHSDAVMENLLGAEADNWAALAGEPGVAIHLYGKGKARPGRKMGHVTRLSPLTP